MKILPLVLAFMTGFFTVTGQPVRMKDGERPPARQKMPEQGTAVVITGAASRIPQEASLLEQLYRKGWLKDVCFISGASSGALNTVVLNAILDGTFTWERYSRILDAVRSNQIYRKNDKKLPFSTVPLRNFLTHIVHDTLGYSLVGDLPFPSAISATHARLVPLKIRTYRFSNRLINDESDPRYDLVDVLMASTAIPLVFPPVRIRDSTDFPDETFIDGGVSEDHIPFEAVLQYMRETGVEPARMVIVSRKLDSARDIVNELSAIGLKDRKLFDRMGISLLNHSKRNFIQKLTEFKQAYPSLASRTYLYIPDFKENFPLLDFNTLKAQRDLTLQWAEKHQPVLLEEYLRENPLPGN